MVRLGTSVLAAFLARLIVALPCAAAGADSSGVLYTLITPPSSLEVGCQGPCACPIAVSPTYGSFVLVQTGVDPLYTHYDVRGYLASFNNGPGAISIMGSGHFKIGGEFARVQELTLDLEIQGQPIEHFDSGLTPVTTDFPRIEISCAVHGFYCFDSVLTVSAKPVETAGAPLPSARATGLEAVQPNPFRTGALIVFALDSSGPVDLMVVDLQGRRVRSLAAGQLFGSGQQNVTWGGLSDDGRPAPAGVYWLLMRWPGGADRRRLVKLD
jgi:hypothetical protein